MPRLPLLAEPRQANEHYPADAGLTACVRELGIADQLGETAKSHE
jgi:hypothetical protein